MPFMPFSKLWLLLRQFSLKSQLFNEIVCKTYVPNLPKSITEYGNHGQKFIYSPTKSMNVPEPICMKGMLRRQLFATNSYTQFHENPTDGLFADVK